MSSLIVKPVILCGGSGTRLWPLSRAGFPKQFLVLSENTSMFQQSIMRANAIASNRIELDETIVMTGEEHRFIALEQLREIPNISSKLLLEPVGKNTAPALTISALEAMKGGNDPILLVMPADQSVQDLDSFLDAIQRCIELANIGSIALLGIKPTAPETGFGYIKQASIVGSLGEYEVISFNEKPNLDVAESYLLDGSYSWNAGIFVVRASVWINAIGTFRKDILDATTKALDFARIDKQFVWLNKNLFEAIPSESIDYAVMEKCPGSIFKVKIIPLNANWSDLGSWDAIWREGDKDQADNLIKGDVLVENSENNLIYANHRLVTVVGVNNLVIIETPDVVMVTDRTQSEQIKIIVNKLAVLCREESILHRKVYRPWGWYDTIDYGDGFKVKRILVNPGAKLSLQKHTKRAEHWVVVRGVAEVTCGEKKISLKENESTFIPRGETHRLSNLSSEVLEIIEVQSGSYLGEDDILRIDDGYGR